MAVREVNYAVSYWMTHPDLENDDCITGNDYETREEAVAAFNAPDWKNGNYIEIDGADIYEVRMKPGHDPKAYQRELERDRRQYDAEARSEMAMQAGMGFGIQGYNEAMGFDSEPYEAPED